MIKFITITIISLILYVSCSKDNGVPPEWFLEEQQNTDATLYGTGQSPAREQAIENAIGNLKEKIYTSVSSTTFLQDKLTNEKTVNEYKKTIKMKTPSITIQNYQIVKIEFRNDIYYATVSVSKVKIIDLIHENLLTKSQKIKPQIERYTMTKNLIKKVKLISELASSCVEYLELERFYNALGFLMEEQICVNSMKEYDQFATKYKVEITNTNPVIHDALSYAFAKKFMLLQRAENVITYNTKIKTTPLNGGYFSGVTIYIMQHNSDEKFEKRCVGNSIKSESEAVNAALEMCLSESKTQTFEEFFNL